MKNTFRSLGLALIGGALCATAGAQSLTLSQVFLTTAGLTGQAPNAFAYHAPSNTLLVGTATAPVAVKKFSGTNGASLGNMDMTGVNATDTLAMFALGTDAAGDIIGFHNNGGAPNINFALWSNTTSAPTFSPTLPFQGNFARNMDAADVTTTAGTATLLAVSAGENDTDTPHIWQKNGSNFTYLGHVDSNASGHPCKAGATISDDGQYVVGSSTISAPNGVNIFRNGTGGALANTNGSAWTYLGSVDQNQRYGDVAIDASKDVGFGLKLPSTNGGTPVTITMFRLSTQQILASTDISLTSVGGGAGNARGGLDLDKTTQRLYVFFRVPADASADAAIGRFDYVAVTTAAQDWSLYQ